MDENKKIPLTFKNLLRYGQIVLTKSWKTQSGKEVTVRYVIWDTSKMNGDDDQKYSENKKKIMKVVMSDGELITMEQV